MGLGALAGGALAGGLIQGGFGMAASNQQQQASQDALAQQMQMFRAQQEAMNAAGNAARGDIANGLYQSNVSLGQGLNQVQNTLGRSQRGAEADLSRQFDLASGMLGSARGNMGLGINKSLGMLESARGDIMSGTSGASSALSGGLYGAENALSGVAGLASMAPGASRAINAYDITGAKSLTEGMLGQDPFANFQQDPGYKFRQQQGEQAINRANAARGGRGGGRAMKELAEFNQGLASQEYGNFANRQLAARGQDLGAAGNVDRQRLSALMNQAGRSDTANLAAQRAQLGLASQGLGAMGQIAGLRSGTGQGLAQLMASQGGQLAGLGRTSANMNMQGTMNMGNLDVQRANMTRGFGSEMANLGMQSGNTLAGYLSNFANARAANQMNAGLQSGNAWLSGAGANSSLAGAMIPQMQAPSQYAGGGMASLGNAATGTLGNLMQLGIMNNMGYFG